LTPRQAARERYGGLTAREREVAAHIAQGRSNREIAAALVLSKRTVDAHVMSIPEQAGLRLAQPDRRVGRAHGSESLDHLATRRDWQGFAAGQSFRVYAIIARADAS
jgi:DNA-binding CsgD family transcriptional regulator